MRALIVEDDLTSRILLRSILEPHFECVMVENGHDAVEAFIESADSGLKYDVVFLDIMMPRKNGYEVLREIRAFEDKNDMGGLRGVKIIMETALNEPDEILSAFREQCEAYITKPYDKEDVFKALASVGISVS